MMRRILVDTRGKIGKHSGGWAQVSSCCAQKRAVPSTIAR
jgi:hypothetical protein